MSRQEALHLAFRILGDHAKIFSGRCEPRIHRTGRRTCSAPDAHGRRCAGGRPFAQVGTWELGSFFAVRGSGRTWEKAIARARYNRHLTVCRKWLVLKKCGSCSELMRKAR